MKLKILAIILILLTLSSVPANAQWEQINKDGFGDKQNFATRGI